MTDLTWINERRKLSDLVQWDNNPRHIRQADAERLVQSLDEFGQIHPIAIAPDGTILDGHQRKQVWSAAQQFGPEYEVDVRVASRALTEQEHQKLVAVLHAGAVGSWDWDQLASWDVDLLKEYGGFDTDLLMEWNDNAANLRELLNAEGEELDYAELWKGMPEFEQEKQGLAVTVHFADEEGRAEFFALIRQRFTDKTKSVWYPERPAALSNQTGRGMVYTDES